ncbi:MAG: helix-turn-helix domain-containing protein [bacterium]|nr:helix-turn-helix domain-containing protein [bacterium]
MRRLRILTTAPIPRASGSLRRLAEALLLLLLILLALPCLAQSAGPPPADSGWSVEQWDSSQGLRHGQPQDLITAVVQSPDGYLWIASLRQVWRFDGMRFEELELPPEIEARINRIFRLHVGAAGDLWIATLGAGAIRVEQGSVSVFSTAEGLLSDRVLTVFEDSRGRVWIAPDRGGLHSFDGDRLSTWGEEQGIGGVTIAELMEDSRGRLWAGTLGRGVFVYERDGFRPFESAMLAGRTIMSMVEDVDGGFWFGTGTGVVHYDPASDSNVWSEISVEDGLSHPVVYDLLFDQSQNLWVATGAGLNRIPTGSVAASADQIEILFPDTWVGSLHRDRESSLWAGTLGDGLKRLRRGGLRLFGRSGGMPSDTIQSIYEDGEGHLWVGTQRGVVRLEDGILDSEHMEVFLGSIEIEVIGGWRDGAVWVGTAAQGLVRLEFGARGAKQSSLTTGNGLPSGSVTALYRDSQDRLWLGWYGGMGRLVGGELQVLGTNHGYQGQGIQCFHEDSSGVLRIGTSEGMLRFDSQNDRFTVVELPGIATPLIVSAIHEDRQGSLWLATLGSGLLRLADGRLAQLTENDGLRSNRLYQIFEDEHGFFWLTGASGVFRARWEDLQAAADNPGGESIVHCRSVGQQSVLPYNHWSNPHRSTSTMTREGELLIGTVNGIAAVTAGDFEINKQPPQVVVEEVLRNGRSVDLHTLSPVFYGRSDMDFCFTAPSFISPWDLLFKVQLEGRDDDYKLVRRGEDRTVRYDDLGPGRYQLRVLAANSDGVWNRTGATFDFRVRPHIYETVPFRVGAVLLAAFAVIGIYYSLVTFVAWRRQRKRYRSSTLTQQAARENIEKLRTLMVRDAIYRDQDLSLESLAARLEILPKHLSQIVNEHLEQSFRDFINGYRVEEAKRLLREDPQLTVLGIAHQVGFNTNDAFYRAFKKHTGTTPSAYRKNNS